MPSRFAPAQANYINRIDPTGYLFSLLRQHEQAISNIANQANADPSSPQTPAPPQVSAVAASAIAPGVLHIQVQDNNPVTRGIWYHYEVSTTEDFQVGTVIHVGSSPSRDMLVNVGAGPVFARAYSQYLTSAPSQPVSAPQSIDPGGSARTGAISGTGSGTESSVQPQPGAGFGFTPVRGIKTL